ncbi:hypothetical protein ACHAWF_016589 [Thalassiosira exigua]
MIRAGIVPVIRRSRRSALATACVAGAGAACLATAPSYRARDQLSSCSAYSDNDGRRAPMEVSSLAMSLPNIAANFEQCSSLLVPTLEALIRAVRLVKTAGIMAADYQTYLHRKNPDSLFSLAYSWAFLCNNHSTADARQRELEEVIDRLESQLERAQLDYVKPQSEDEQSNQVSDHPDELNLSERTLSGAKREQKEVMLEIAGQLSTAEKELASLLKVDGGDDENAPAGIHKRNARRLLDLCRTNGGVYVKVGQHLANLDLLLPEEYIQTLSSLFDSAPTSSYQDVCQVVMEELGSLPSELFGSFSEEPLASASLAQVHTAICKETGKKLAIKIQHKGLRETSAGDLFAMSAVVNVADKLFDGFTFRWISDELTPQLPKELDFKNEGRNGEAAAAHLKTTGLDCVVPRVLWDFTSDRVLTMEFEEGFRATDVVSIDRAGICRRDVAKLISSVFNAQIFGNGFVHCDPHEANVLLREHPSKRGKPQLVLIDHGLYKSLDGDFQEAYARLWQGIVVADIPQIKSSCELLGVHEMYTLLAGMLTSRPFDEVIERSQTRSLDASSTGSGDKAVIKGYAQRYIKEIIAMLDIVPRQMLLIFKMNDCLRHVDMALGSPVNNLVVAGRYASERVFESDKKRSNGRLLDLIRSWFSYLRVLVRINSYELYTRLSLTQ